MELLLQAGTLVAAGGQTNCMKQCWSNRLSTQRYVLNQLRYDRHKMVPTDSSNAMAGCAYRLTLKRFISFDRDFPRISDDLEGGIDLCRHRS